MAKLYVRKSDGTYVPQQSVLVSNLDIVQSKGDSLTSAMSQKAVTDELATKQNTIPDLETIRSNSQNASDVVTNMTIAGYLFAGIATPTTDPGSPDAKVFYIANSKGTYTNLGGIKVTEDEVVVLYYDTAWHKEATGIASQEKLTELEIEVGIKKQVEVSFELGTIIGGSDGVNDKYARTPNANKIPLVEETTFTFTHTSTSQSTANSSYYFYKDGVYTGLTGAFDHRQPLTLQASADYNQVRFRLYYGVTIDSSIANATKVSFPIPTKIESLEKEVGEINKKIIEDATLITDVHPSDTWEMKSMQKNASFKFLLFSDIHKAETNLSRILSLAKAWGTSAVDAIINGGDSVTSLIDEDLSWYDTKVNASSFDVLNCAGNHDCWTQRTYNLATPQVVYNKIIAPMVSRVQGVVQPTNAQADGLCYYYKDYGNIRVIILNAMTQYWISGVTGTEQSNPMYWDAAQATWLTSVLADAKTNNKSVICVNHTPFNPSDRTEVKGNWNSYVTSTDDLSLNHQAIGIVGDFIANGGDFICWFAGHTHFDKVYVAQGQMMFVITSARYNFKGDGVTATDVKQKQYDAINYIAIDTTNHLVKIMRIGWNMDASMKERTPLCYNYKDKEIVG